MKNSYHRSKLNNFMMLLHCFTNKWTVAVMCLPDFSDKEYHTFFFYNVLTNNDGGSWIVANERLPQDLQISFIFSENWTRFGLTTKISWWCVLTQIWIELYKKVRMYGQKKASQFFYLWPKTIPSWPIEVTLMAICLHHFVSL